MRFLGVEHHRKRKEKKSIMTKMPAVKHAASSSVKGKILVMDDESFITDIIHTMLVESGYDACITRDGDEAVKRFETAKNLGRPFNAVILDLHVPAGTEGRETIEKLRKMDPEVRAILLTGDITHTAVTDYEKLGFNAALIKPFTRGELVQRVQWVLDKSSDGQEVTEEI